MPSSPSTLVSIARVRTAARSLACATLVAAAIDVGAQPAVRPDAIARYIAVDAPVVALTHARLVDGTGDAVREDQTIVIAGTRIVAVGASATTPTPSAARVIDLTGHTVLPGFVGMHEHTYFQTRTRLTQMSVSAARLYLANGVTTIRTAGSMMPYAELNMKRAIDEGRMVGPRMHVAGPYLDGGPASARSPVRFLRSPAEARRVVAYWAAEGATWFKFMGDVPRSVLRAGIEEAHAHGARVTAHLCAVTFRDAAALGIDGVEHGFITDSDFIPEKRPDVCPADNQRRQAVVDVDGAEVQRSIRALVQRGVAVTSTLAVYELFVPGRARLDARALDAMAPDIRRDVEADHAALGSDSAEATVPPVLFDKMMRYERAFVRAGGRLVAGVDPWGNGAVPGHGDLRNFELLVEAGFSVPEVVRIMSANGAAVLGELSQRGTITVGKAADLAVVRGDPTRTPSDIYAMALVFRDGVGYDPARLIASVRGKIGVW